MPETRDCLVLGVGGFGSAVLAQLAQRGVQALGIEQFDIAHNRGSSHGQTRIIRQAYFEHPDYVPLCLRAYELWDELQRDAGQPLLQLCGLLLAGPPAGEAVAGAQLAASLHHLPLEEMTAEEAMRRFPAFRIPAENQAVFEEQAGYLFVEECVKAQAARAVADGAEIRTGETVLSWSSDGQRVQVETDKATYRAAQLVLTPGAWAPRLLGDALGPLEIRRKLLFWHEVQEPTYDVRRGCPAYLFERPHGVFYGFPSLDGKILKVAEHSGGERVIDPARIDRQVHLSDIEPVERFLEECLPGVVRPAFRHAVCMYTMTPDRHFLVGRHPEYENVFVGAGFSGHGFKFTPVIGEALADLVTTGKTAAPVDFLSPGRFSS